MNAKKFSKLLISLKACEDASEWSYNKDWKEVYETCERGDWLLWLYQNTNHNKRKLVLAAAKCAETVIRLMKDDRSKKAIEVAIRYGLKDATEKELKKAAEAAAEAAAAEDITKAAAYTAAYAAAYAAAAAADDAAYDAAAAAAAAAADAAADDVRNKHLKRCADIVRGIIKFQDYKF
jgi:hypothetical protein